MSHRPLIFVSGLTLADYGLWNWSLSGNHGVLELVSGLTLPPLVAALLWLLTLNVARLAIARSSRRSAMRAENIRIAANADAGRERERRPVPRAGANPLSEPAASTRPTDASSRRIAA